MRKRIINQRTPDVTAPNQQWLNLERLAQVEVTSEDPALSIESALIPDSGPGWRAAQPGKQTVRLLFDEPQKIRRVHLFFQENDQERTQEFVLRWSPDGGQSYRDVVRQQYHFSPPGTTDEREEYNVDLDRVTALELTIVPDISGAFACASIAELRLM